MKAIKRILSVLLIAAIVITLPGLQLTAVQAADENLPIVFVGGKGTLLVDKDGDQTFPRNFDFAGMAKGLLPSLTRANLTFNYDQFGKDLNVAIADLYKGLPLDCNGVASNGTNTDFKWTKTQLSWSVRKDEPYRLYDYCFYYDWRVDPCETADIFAAYIDDVLEVTGAPKVKIVGRCLGGSIVIAYLSEYGCEKVDRCLFYVTTINGVATPGAAFAGDFSIDNEAAARFASDLGMDDVFSLGDPDTNQLVAAAVRMLSDTGGIDLAVAAVKNVYDHIKEESVPELLLSTYATFPSYWGMIGDDYYEEAKQFVFGGREEEYAGLIAKIDNYHYNIQTKVSEILKRLESEGLDITVVCKYGAQQVPISKEYECLSDNTVELYRSSFGATCTEIDETFNAAYLDSADAKYISADEQVDCSTALFPDNTWVIKNCAHSDFGKSIDAMMMAVMNYPGRMSVNDNPDYPQFMVYNKEEDTLSPLTAENCYTTERWDRHSCEVMLDAVKTLIELAKEAINAE